MYCNLKEKDIARKMIKTIVICEISIIIIIIILIC